ncbi:MAG: ABC transporter substrate-binding protein [Gammaproteobacteria bacterium]
MLRRLKNLSKFLILLLIFFVSSCSEQNTSENIYFGLSTDPVTLDPRFATDAVSNRINRLIYKKLVSFDQNYQAIPNLATWKKISEKQYQFILGKDDLDFHDGTKLTSEDVRVSYESVLDKKTASPHRGALQMIERIETPDSKTINFYLNKIDPLFPGRLSLGILPAHLINKKHAFNKQPVGSGPIKFMSWPQSESLFLKRISDQKIIKFITVKDPTVRALKLVRGELDLFQGDIPQEMLGWLEKQQEVIIDQKQGNIFSYLGFNMKDPVVGQLKVRQAIAHSLNKEEIINYIFLDTARNANAMLPPEHWAGNPDLKTIKFDLIKAKNILKNLGFDDKKPLKIVYKTSNNNFRIRLATVMQHQLKKVGIELQIRSYDWGTFYGDIKAGNFQMYSLSWVGLKLPDIFRTVFHSKSIPPEGANRGRFFDQKIDQIIEAAELENNQKKQISHYRKIQSRLLEQLPYIPLWYEDTILIKRSNIKKYTLAADGNYDGLFSIQKN